MTQTWPFSGLWLAFLKQIPLSFSIFIRFRWSTNCLQELHRNLLQRKPGDPLKSSNPNIRQRWFNSCWKNTCLDAQGTNKKTQQPRFSELQTAGYVVQTFKARELPITTVKIWKAPNYLNHTRNNLEIQTKLSFQFFTATLGIRSLNL